jgi:peptidoglycan/xylan/chitin deacetylase (PgdA/CDA1 family)
LNGRISKDDLRALQDQYGWEIGTHTWNHFNAPRYIGSHGLTNWLEQKLDPALATCAMPA